MGKALTKESNACLVAPVVFKTVGSSSPDCVSASPAITHNSLFLSKLTPCARGHLGQFARTRIPSSAQLVPSFLGIHTAVALPEKPAERVVYAVYKARSHRVADSKACDVIAIDANHLGVKAQFEETPAEQKPPSLMDKASVAQWLGVCVKTVDNWLLEGWLPVLQPSPRIQRFKGLRRLTGT